MVKALQKQILSPSDSARDSQEVRHPRVLPLKDKPSGLWVFKEFFFLILAFKEISVKFRNLPFPNCELCEVASTSLHLIPSLIYLQSYLSLLSSLENDAMPARMAKQRSLDIVPIGQGEHQLISNRKIKFPDKRTKSCHLAGLLLSLNPFSAGWQSQPKWGPSRTNHKWASLSWCFF